jgi:hypothetical protein
MVGNAEVIRDRCDSLAARKRHAGPKSFRIARNPSRTARIGLTLGDFDGSIIWAIRLGARIMAAWFELAYVR